jgi:hypothetical protein
MHFLPEERATAAGAADRKRSPLVGPVGAAWVFTRIGGARMQQGKKLVGAASEYGGGSWSKVRRSPSGRGTGEHWRRS